MRSLEIAFLFLSLPILLSPLIRSRRVLTIANWLPVVSAILMLLHLRIEGYRWQMLPGYLLVLCLLPLGIRRSFRDSSFSYWVSAGGLILLVAAMTLGTILPVFSFPPLTGPYPVGTVTMHLIDRSRAETFSSNPQDRRELMVQIWYPAQSAGHERALYASRATVPLKKSQLALVRTRSWMNVPVSNAQPRFPVLIFVPSLNGGRGQNTFETEELASHGFIVVGIDHPYGTNVTQFPDGRIVHTRLPDFLNYQSDEALKESIRILDEQVKIRALDAIFVLGEVRQLNATDPGRRFQGRLDLDRVGIFGHSFGGAVAAEACWLSPDFKAGVNMDGLSLGEAAEQGVPQPFLTFSEDGSLPSGETASSKRALQVLQIDDERARSRFARYGGYAITVRGTLHSNFSDSPLFTPIKRVTEAGPIDPQRAVKIINAYTLAFFEKYLNHSPQTLLDGPSPDYPEVKLEVHHSPGKRESAGQ